MPSNLVSSQEQYATALALNDRSVLTFDLHTNRHFKHRIVLERAPADDGNQWLGITFRTSKTFLRFSDSAAYLPDHSKLKLANDDEAREFLQLRRKENNEIEFSYPKLNYTLSESDLMPPVFLQ